MKAKRTLRNTLAGLLLVAVAGAPGTSNAGPASDGRIAPDRDVEIRVVPVEDIGPVPKLTRRPVRGHAPQVSVWTSPETGSLVYPGEDVSVRFRVDRDAFVVVYDIDTRGRVRLLYRDRPGDDGYVRSGRVKRIPGRHAGYRLMVTGPPGVERVVALASDRPLLNRWRRLAEEDLAEMRYDGRNRHGEDIGFRASVRIGDEDAGFTAVIASDNRGDYGTRVVRRPVNPRLVPVPRGRAAISRDETWFRVGRRWRW